MSDGLIVVNLPVMTEPASSKLKILQIEADPVFEKLLSSQLSTARDSSFDIERVGTLQEGLEQLRRGGIDGVLLDLNLPDSKGLAAIDKVYAQAPAVPIVVSTATDDDVLGVEALRRGAQEYIFKGHIHTKMICRVLNYAIERKRIEGELRKAYQELKEAQRELIQSEKLAALGRFSSGLAHEVKNPLAIVLSGIEFLQRSLPDTGGETQTSLAKIREAARRADTIIHGLLQFSSPSQLKTERVRPEAIIEEALSLFKYRTALENVSLKTEFFKKYDLWVNVDKNQIQQVLFNLLLNAVEAMPHGGRVTVRTYPARREGPSSNHEACVIEVVDTGEGVPKENLSRVFEPFFTTKRDKRGTGLGLSTSKTIIESHGGGLLFESEPGKGTAVKAFIPLALREDKTNE